MSFGGLDGDGQVAQIEGHPFGPISFTGTRYAQADIRLLSPILPSKVVCVGKNYAAHIEEMKGLTGDAPEEPLLFLKPSTAVIGPGDAIRIPPGSTNVQHEVELAVVIGARGARKVSPEQAMGTVFGYSIGNDVTERDLQRKDGQSTRAKGFDSFCPLGPWIEPDLGGLGRNPTDLEICCSVDGELRQQGRTSQLIFSISTLISYISQVMTLLPGDVVLTGTPSGVGPIRPGQRVDCTVEGLGTLSNTVTAGAPGSTAGGRGASPGSARRRPGWCTSGPCGRRCSTGRTRGTPAAPSCSASRTPTPPATPRSPTGTCSTACGGWGWTGTRVPRSAARTARTGSRSGTSSTATSPRSCSSPATATSPSRRTRRSRPGGWRPARTPSSGTTTPTGS